MWILGGNRSAKPLRAWPTKSQDALLQLKTLELCHWMQGNCWFLFGSGNTQKLGHIAYILKAKSIVLHLLKSLFVIHSSSSSSYSSSSFSRSTSSSKSPPSWLSGVSSFTSGVSLPFLEAFGLHLAFFLWVGLFFQLPLLSLHTLMTNRSDSLNDSILISQVLSLGRRSCDCTMISASLIAFSASCRQLKCSKSFHF